MFSPCPLGKAAEREKGDKEREQLGYAFLRKNPCNQTYDENPEISNALTTDPVSSVITGPEEARKWRASGKGEEAKWVTN